MRKKCLVIDGNNLIYRSYYASQKINWIKKNKEVYIFLLIMLKLVKKNNYEKVFVAFDESKKTFRNDFNSDYKANRKKMPEEIVETLKKTREIIDLMEICQESNKNFEADDLIASFVENFKNEKKWEFHILSQDKDLLQLISENVKILKYKNKKIEEIDEKKFFLENGFSSKNLVYYLSLMGDKADNIKGVDGIGQKRAKIIVSKLENLKNTFCNLELLPIEIKKIINGKENQIKKNIQVVTLMKKIKTKSLESCNFSFLILKKNEKFINFCQESGMKNLVSLIFD